MEQYSDLAAPDLESGFGPVIPLGPAKQPSKRSGLTAAVRPVVAGPETADETRAGATNGRIVNRAGWDEDDPRGDAQQGLPES